jgi:hypothetical protein
MLFREMTTGNAISGVSVDVEGLDEFVSGTDGRVAIGLTSSGIYNVTISKNGYLSQTGQIQTGVNYIIQLEPDTTTDDNGNQISRTILTINVKDTLGNPIPSATVSATEQITATSKTAQTDINGNAYLLDLLAGTPLRISVGKAPASDCVQTINGQGQISFDCSQSATSTPIYQSTFLTTTLANGEQKTINVILLKTNQLNYTTARGCEDYVEGIWLCSPLNITGTGDACHQDSDCITGRCEAGNSPDYRKCSQFNWTQCDALGRDRGNKCFTAVMGGRGIENLTNTMMDNFLYVLIGVFLFIALIMFINSVSGK